jgi:hypothetical protein
VSEASGSVFPEKNTCLVGSDGDSDPALGHPHLGPFSLLPSLMSGLALARLITLFPSKKQSWLSVLCCLTENRVRPLFSCTLPSPNHPLAHAPTHSLTHPSVHSFIHSFTHSPTSSPIHSCIHSLTHTRIPPFILIHVLLPGQERRTTRLRGCRAPVPELGRLTFLL